MEKVCGFISVTLMTKSNLIDGQRRLSGTLTIYIRYIQLLTIRDWIIRLTR